MKSRRRSSTPPPLPPPHPQLAPAKIAARDYGLSYWAIRHSVFTGILPVIRIGRAWYLDRGDLEKWVEAEKARSLAEFGARRVEQQEQQEQRG